MQINKVTNYVSVSPQIQLEDVKTLAELGFKSIICNRPDGEDPGQPNFVEIKAEAKKYNIDVVYLPVVSRKITDEDAEKFKVKLRELPAPLLAYCRTGTRSITLWSLGQASKHRKPSEILKMTKAAGYDMSSVVRRIVNGGKTPTDVAGITHDVVIIGAGAAGIAVASSLLKRKKDLDVAIIDPAEIHYYQPGWTMVGAGVFAPEQTVKTIASLIPKQAKWIKAAVAAFEPDNNAIILNGCRVVHYKHLIVCPGLKLDWKQIEGLEETLGKNGVTSNYRYDLASYTWELVQNLRSGKAVFCQPPMPIKCAGAPQKAMYMSADHWFRSGTIKKIDIEFYNAIGVLFGVKEYVPALMEYVEKYNANLNFDHTLFKIDGVAKKAWFKKVVEGKDPEIVEIDFDMIHVVPPQTAPDFVRVSPLVDEAGWVDVDHSTLRHRKYKNIYSLGDVMNAPNAKTVAAARKQAPTVAINVLHDMGHTYERAIYDGYGACPLTVERGKIVLAEFGYGGTLMPSFPKFIIDGTRPSRLSWLLKERILPPIYWKAMLKGREWMVRPSMSSDKVIPEQTGK
ncbi:MAG: TIGR01244 family protein [Micavibrio sp. TMED27]|jgi:sulfide:quinone oxidoreductase|nr:TIGR01244 family phosphatase [Micavibrio sp.]OUT92881.1 MAG: TIGR01244 family protein [Micavibrio sp. TMED27]HIL28826.1 TIGR01244 family phosphatase [Micavibrio sp.]|tara:strand:- start:6542 stop:8242 length:1701 start_codon:yes stop_codon:yes gene_type:complete